MMKRVRFPWVCLLAFLLFANNGYSKKIGKKVKKEKNKYAEGNEMHEAAANVIALSIAADSGLPGEDYRVYSLNLADTLGQLSMDDLSEVLGDKIGKLP